MRIQALIAAALLALSQSVLFVDCCCGDLCAQPNSCSGCADEAACPGSEASGKASENECTEKSECAGRSEDDQEKACIHVVPSDDVEHSTTLAFVTPAAFGQPAVLDGWKSSTLPGHPLLTADPPLRDPPFSPLLYLLHETFLI